MATIGSPVGPALDAAALAGGVPTAVAGAYLVGLAVAALRYKTPPGSEHPTTRLVVLIPAYNEADLIQRCISTLADQTYPRSLYEIVVIADNCTDDTARLASESGAQVLIRNQPDAPGKGPALRWAMDTVLTAQSPPDAVVVVDADSVADRGLLSGLVGAMEHGAEAAQAEYRVLREAGSTKTDLRAAAFLLFHRVRFAGRSVLGLPCNLVGNGMLFTRSLLEAHPWDAFTSAEDLDYSIRLRLAGIGPVFAGAAIVEGPVPTSDRSANIQRQRWEGGRLHVARKMIPRLARSVFVDRHLSQLDAIVDLLVPPLGLLAAGAIGGLVVFGVLGVAGLVPLWVSVPWLVSVVEVGGFVLIGLRAADAPASLYRSLLAAPMFVVKKVLGIGGVLKGAGGDTWVRTERPSERAG